MPLSPEATTFLVEVDSEILTLPELADELVVARAERITTDARQILARIVNDDGSINPAQLAYSLAIFYAVAENAQGVATAAFDMAGLVGGEVFGEDGLTCKDVGGPDCECGGDN